MFKVVFFFLVLFTGNLVAQNLKLEGKILDSRTKKGIPFANLIFENVKIGTSADIEGGFKFAINSNLKTETVLVSCVGYEERSLKASELEGRTIFLNQKTDVLSEVMIYKMNLSKKKRINPFRGKQTVGLGNFSGGAYPSALARYYERPKGFKNGCFLNSIEIQFFKVLGQSSQAATFRLRILNVLEDGKPGVDLLESDIILKKPEGSRKLNLDLSTYKLNIPEEGFFVSVEHIFIEDNKFTEAYTIKVNDSVGYKNYLVDRYAPIFKGIETTANDAETRCFYKSIHGWKPINLLDTQESVLKGNLPAPAFKILVTD